ncbi:MAG: HNH endonuclease signature motif containing protein [Bdellovibrionota bacterium]
MNCSKGLNTKVILNLIAAISLTLTASFASAQNYAPDQEQQSAQYVEKKKKPAPAKPNQPSKPGFQEPDKAPTAPLNPTGKYPIQPDTEMTPGKLCEHGTKRYAQQITYCERDVSSGQKNAIIKDYDQELGFKIQTMDRGVFKIDHFIPLSIGGSNDVENLWPQHKSVYAYSDRLELLVYQAMEADKIAQAKAIEVIKECKLDLPKCSGLEDYVSDLMK